MSRGCWERWGCDECGWVEGCVLILGHNNKWPNDSDVTTVGAIKGCSGD